MKALIVSRQHAIQMALRLKEKAFSLANSYGTLPGYCKEPECVMYCDYTALTQLGENEGAIVIDNKVARWITGYNIEGHGEVIGKMCVKNAKSADIINNELVVTYNDGVREYFSYIEDLECYKFKYNSLGTTIKAEEGVLN
jgi:hypothetical protein